MFPDAVGLQLSAQVGSSLSLFGSAGPSARSPLFSRPLFKVRVGAHGAGFPAPGRAFPGMMTHLRTLTFGGLMKGTLATCSSYSPWTWFALAGACAVLGVTKGTTCCGPSLLLHVHVNHRLEPQHTRDV